MEDTDIEHTKLPRFSGTPEAEGLKPLALDDFFYVKCEDYDELIEVSIPYYKRLHEVLERCLPFEPSKPLNVLDLGVGTGKTLGRLLDRYPQARGVGVDLFRNMLSRAQANLARYANRTQFIEGDMRTLVFEPFSFDLVVSVLAIHHLEHREKRSVLRSIQRWLGPGGIFMLGDWTAFSDPYLAGIATKVADAHVIELVGRGKIPQATADEWIAHWRDVNLPATVEEQLAWMREVGFSQASCIFRYYGIALMMARLES